MSNDAHSAPARSDAIAGMTSDRAIGWSVAMCLLAGYGNANDADAIERRTALLARTWHEEMTRTENETGLLVSCVMTPSAVIYPEAYGCPAEGERTVTISGGSNPARVAPDQFDDYVAAVEATILRVQRVIRQTSVRIEFHEIVRSTYSRTQDRQQA